MVVSATPCSAEQLLGHVENSRPRRGFGFAALAATFELTMQTMSDADPFSGESL